MQYFIDRLSYQNKYNLLLFMKSVVQLDTSNLKFKLHTISAVKFSMLIKRIFCFCILFLCFMYASGNSLELTLAEYAEKPFGNVIFLRHAFAPGFDANGEPDKFKIDDAVGAVAVHGNAGVAGLIICGFVLNGYPSSGYSVGAMWVGTDYAPINPLGMFLGGIIMFVVLGLIPGWIIAKILHGMGKLRIPRDAEIAGLDYNLLEALDKMKKQFPQDQGKGDKLWQQ